MKPLEIYAQVILHPGCGIPPKGEEQSRPHKWDECRSQEFFMRIARKHQHKLKSNGLVIGEWVKIEHLFTPYSDSPDWGRCGICGEDGVVRSDAESFLNNGLLAE